MRQKIYTKNIILILAASFFYMSSAMLVTPLITGFAGSIGASAAVMGMIGGLMNLCSLICRPIAGNLADKISKYKLAFVGSVFMIASCLGYVGASQEVVIMIARLVNGVGFACCSVCMTTWMSDMLPKEKIGSGMGLYGTMNALAMATAPAIGVRVYQTLGYRAAFLIATGFAIATAVGISLVTDRGEPSSKSGRKLELVEIRVIPIALIIMFLAIPYCATQSFLVSYVETRQLPVSVSLFFPAYALVLLILRLCLKDWLDRIPFRCFLGMSCVSAFLGIFFLAQMKSNLTMFVAAAFMAGGYGIMCSVCQSTAILLAGKEKRGLANSTYYIGMDLGMTFGPVIGGFLFGHLPIGLFYPVLLLTVPMVVVVYALAGRNIQV